MRISPQPFILLLTLLPQFILAQSLPLQYSYSCESPSITKSKNRISIHQESDFAILQSHPKDQKPDFTPKNHWDYSLNGNFSENQFVMVKKIKERPFLVLEQKERAFTDPITYHRKVREKTLYTVSYSNLSIDFTEWIDDTAILNQQTRHATLKVKIDATIYDSDGEILDNLDGTMQHEIWISKKVPFSPVAYNLLMHVESPKLFIEPQNYKITNERPWLSISRTIYANLADEIEDQGMIIKMNSNYNYTNSKGKNYQSEAGKLSLEEIRQTEQRKCQAVHYPIVANSLYKKMYDAARYAEVESSSLSSNGSFELKTEKIGNYQGSAIFESTQRFFAVRAQAMNKEGDTLNMVLLKVDTKMPHKGKQILSKDPISSIREQMQQGPPEGYTQQFFAAGTLKQGEEIIYFSSPVEGSLHFKQVSENKLYGSFEIIMQATHIKKSKSKQRREKIKATFQAERLELSGNEK
ncbi:MAG: hypothetical protein WD530_04835 [Vicingaceae bacterium]